jgi:hypothetical protein
LFERKNPAANATSEDALPSFAFRAVHGKEIKAGLASVGSGCSGATAGVCRETGAPAKHNFKNRTDLIR